MTTVTGLTAARMLQIEAASVVDGDVISGNLILTKHDGTTINAGPVTGPQGPAGPIGQDLSVLSSIPVLDIGISNQIRAGRQLTLQDFTNIGLNAPVGLWNLSDLTDASGNARSLTNKGAIPFAPGINGVANTAAQFVGSTSQALYISDTGAADPFRIKTGSWGCWFRTAKRSTAQYVMSKLSAAAGQRSWGINIDPTSNAAQGSFYSDGTSVGVALGVTDVCDDRWHFVVVTYDGSALRTFVDCILEASWTAGTTPIFGGSGPVNIGSMAADGSTAAVNVHYGRVDEAFVTADILTEDQIRNLYCAKIPHTLSTTPMRASINVRRRRKGAAFVVTDFPTQPLRLYNFSAGSLGDEGSNAQAVVATNAPLSVSGADGSSGNAYNFIAGSNQILSSVDTGLPAGVTPRSFGCWLKTAMNSAFGTLLNWGTLSTGEARLDLSNVNPSTIRSISNGDVITGPVVGDSVWHFIVNVEDNAAIDGVKRKLYVDGRLVGTSTTMNSITLGGGSHFRIGSCVDGSQPLTGQVDGVFICDYALTPDVIRMLYAKGSQSLGISPKNSGDHIETIRATDLLAIFDTLDSQHQIDLAVA